MVKNIIARYNCCSITTKDPELLKRRNDLKMKNGNISDEDIYIAGIDALEKEAVRQG